jgi:hypothetical protein
MKVPTFKTLLFSLTIIALLLVTILELRQNQKITATALTIAQIAEIRAGLSLYGAERGEYPLADNLILGGEQAQILCLAGDPKSEQGFLLSGKQCNGEVLINFTQTIPISKIIYSSTGEDYKISLILPAKLGAFSQSGFYCANKKGILVGKCQ